jgi:hypothetical protein
MPNTASTPHRSAAQPGLSGPGRPATSTMPALDGYALGEPLATTTAGTIHEAVDPDTGRRELVEVLHPDPQRRAELTSGLGRFNAVPAGTGLAPPRGITAVAGRRAFLWTPRKLRRVPPRGPWVLSPPCTRPGSPTARSRPRCSPSTTPGTCTSRSVPAQQSRATPTRTSRTWQHCSGPT